MELWIRSQDKEKLLKCDDITIKNHRYDTMDEYGNRCINYKGYEIVGYFDKNTEYETLGTYKTKERALEVLDEIQELIKPKQIITTYESEIKECINKTTFDVVMTPKIDNIQLIEPTTLVYEMPAE